MPPGRGSGNRTWFWETLVEVAHTRCVRDPATGCMMWQRGVDKDGYPKIYIEGKQWRGCRAVLFALTGELGPVARHTCHRPGCLNPDHLLWGTVADNTRDKWEAGRGVINFRVLSGSLNGRSKLTPEQRAEITSLRRSGVSRAEVAERFGIDETSVHRVAKAGGFTAPIGRPKAS